MPTVTFQSGTLATPPAGTVIAVDNVGGGIHQRVKRTVGAEGFATDFLDKISQSTTFTTVDDGPIVDVSAQGMSRPSLQVVQTGTVTAWTVCVMASLNGSDWHICLTHKKTSDGGETAAGSGAVAFPGANTYPALYFKIDVIALTLGAGTNIICHMVVLP